MNTTLIHEQEGMLAIIKSLPGNYLILLPDAPRYTIVEVSEAYTKATFTNRNEIVGRGIFEVFPDDRADLDADGVKNLSASFGIVLETQQTHEMAIQRHPVTDPSKNGFSKSFGCL